VTCRWFSPDTLVSSIDKTDRHDITDILLKVALNTMTLTLIPSKQWQLIPETTMHVFDINALLTMIAINKRTRKNSRNDRSRRSVVFSTNKTVRHDITDILLKVALNTMTLTLIPSNIPSHTALF
jgi:hypothetical protein